jgi:WD40 repeat protein/class 3 adenylate cyclase/GTPase SAR1 family protein
MMAKKWKTPTGFIRDLLKKMEGDAAGERETGIILLLDVVNFGIQSGKVGDERTGKFLKKFVKKIKEAIKRHKAAFIKTEGDAVLIFINDIVKFLDLIEEFRQYSKDGFFDSDGILAAIRMVAHYGRFRFSTVENGQPDVIGAEVIVPFRIEKIAGKHQVVITGRLFDLIKDDLKDRNIRYECIGSKKFKSFEPMFLYRLIFPDEFEVVPQNLSSLEDAMKDLETRTLEIPVFGDFYPPIAMEKNFINLDIAREGDFIDIGIDSRLSKTDSSRKREHPGTFEKRDAEDKEEKRRETIEEKGIKQRSTNAAALYNEYRKGVILGMPGSGKTTILSYFAYRELEKNREIKEKNEKRVVLFIECRNVMDFDEWYRLSQYQEWPEEFDPEFDTILKYFSFNFLSKGKSPTSLLPEEIEELGKAEKVIINAFEKGNLTLLIDALDECKSMKIKERIVDFVRTLFKNLTEKGHQDNERLGSRIFLTARYFEKQEHFTGKDASIFEPTFEVRHLDREQLRELARYFYADKADLFKEFDEVVWQDESLIKVAGTPLTALLVLAYFENFRQLDTRYSLYNILITFILIRAWEQIKSKSFQKKMKDMKTFFRQARKKDIFRDEEYKEAGEVYDILSFLAYNFLAEKAKGEPINEATILRIFGKFKKDGTTWVNRFVEDHLLARTGYDQYVFIHFTVMEYLAARFIVEKVKDKNFLEAIKYDIDFKKAERDFFESEIIPIAVGSEVMIGIEILRLLKAYLNKIVKEADRRILYKTAFRVLSEFESFILRKKKAEQIKYLIEETEKILRENTDACDWIYKYISRLLLENNKEKLKEAREEFNGVVKLSQPVLLERYLYYGKFSECDSEIELNRTKLLEQLIDGKHIDKWLDTTQTTKIQRSLLEEEIEQFNAVNRDLSIFDSRGFSPEDKNFGYYENSIGIELNGFLGSPNLKHSKSVNCIRITGNTIISGSNDGTIKFWDFHSGKEILCLDAHSDGVIGIGITEEIIVSAGSNGVIKLWDKECGEEIRSFDTQVSKLSVMVINGENIVVGAEDGTIKIVNIGKDGAEKTLNTHQGEIESLAVAGKTIISGAADGSINSWNLETGHKQRTFKGHEEAVRNIVVVGDTFISGASDGTIKLWDLETGKEIKVFERHSERIFSIAVSGNKIAAGCGDGFIKIWDMNTGKVIRSIRAHIFPVNSVAVKDNIIVSAAGDAAIKLWYMDNGKEVMSFKRHHEERINSVAIMGSNIVSGSDDNTVKIWDREKSKETVLRGHNMNVNCVLLIPGAIISGAAGASIKIWDMKTSREIRTLKGHRSGVNCLAFKDNMIISGAFDKTIKLWDKESGEEIFTFTGHKDRVNCLEAVDGFIVSGAANGEIKIWNVESRREVDSFKAHEMAVSDVAVVGKKVISASYDHTVKLWDQGKHRCIYVFEGHTQPVNCVEIIGGHIVISGASDRTLKLWDIHSGQCIKTIRLAWIPLDIACNHGNLNNIVTANANGTLTIFDLGNILNPKHETGK